MQFDIYDIFQWGSSTTTLKMSTGIPRHLGQLYFCKTLEWKSKGSLQKMFFLVFQVLNENGHFINQTQRKVAHLSPIYTFRKQSATDGT